MDLKAIRTALADILNEIPGVRAYDKVPDVATLGQSETIIVQPDSPYVRYQPVNGMTNQNQVGIVLRIIPHQSSARSAQDRVDELLSCGSDQPRSIRTKLGSNISAGGTACQVVPDYADEAVETIAGDQFWCMDFHIQVLARC